MSVDERNSCGECVERADGVARRDFLRVVGGGALWLAANGGAAPLLAAPQGAQPAAARAAKPAEALIQELYQGLTDAQRQSVVYAWNHGGGGTAIPTRHRMFNQAFGRQAS